MSVIRINKTNNYTVMSNHHLKDKNLSLKAKGLLSVMLSLPNDWNYSINGLVAILKEHESAIKSTLNELKKNEYLKVTKLNPSQTKTGRYEYIYDVFEKPTNEKQEVEKQCVENLGVEVLEVENNHLYKYTKQSNTKELNTNKLSSKTTRHKYGEYKNVLLSDEELEKIKTEFPNDFNHRIERLSEYMASSGKHYKSHLATIRAWARKDKTKKSTISELPNWFDNQEEIKTDTNVNDDELKKMMEQLGSD